MKYFNPDGIQDAIVDWEDPFDLVAREKMLEYQKRYMEIIAKYHGPLVGNDLIKRHKMSQIIYNPEYGPPDLKKKCDC